MGRGCASTGAWLGGTPPSFPCPRWLRFERVFNPNRSHVEALEATYEDASADVQDDCATELKARITEESRRRNISEADLVKMWKDADRRNVTLYGRQDAALLALAPRRHG